MKTNKAQEMAAIVKQVEKQQEEDRIPKLLEAIKDRAYCGEREYQLFEYDRFFYPYKEYGEKELNELRKLGFKITTVHTRTGFMLARKVTLNTVSW